MMPKAAVMVVQAAAIQLPNRVPTRKIRRGGPLAAGAAGLGAAGAGTGAGVGVTVVAGLVSGWAVMPSAGLSGVGGVPGAFGFGSDMRTPHGVVRASGGVEHRSVT